MKQQIVVISNWDTKTFFLSKDHCQTHNLDGYVPCTHYIPTIVVPRESVPDGVVKGLTDLVAVFYHDMKEIPNPDPNMQLNF